MREGDDDLALAIAPLSTREDYTLFVQRARVRDSNSPLQEVINLATDQIKTHNTSARSEASLMSA